MTRSIVWSHALELKLPVSVDFSPRCTGSRVAVAFCSPESPAALRRPSQGEPAGTFSCFPTKEVQGRVSPSSLSHQTHSPPHQTKTL